MKTTYLRASKLRDAIFSSLAIFFLAGSHATANMWWWAASTESGTDFYLEPVASVPSASPHVVRAWSLWDYSNVNIDDRDEIGSVKILHDYDCLMKRWRAVRYQSYRGAMATGDTLADDTLENSYWSEFPEETVAEQLLIKVCASRLLFAQGKP